MPKIAILDDYTSDSLKLADWAKLAPMFEPKVFNTNFGDHDVIINRLRDFEIICAMRERTPFPKYVLENLPKLKLLVTSGMRNASIDILAAEKMGVIVCGTHGSADATPELTWGLILACARNIASDGANLKRGGWQTQLGVELNGKTLGLLGLGKIGRRVAEFGRVFRMNVVAWSPNLTKSRCSDVGVKFVSKDSLFMESDFLSIHLVLGESTRNLVTGCLLSYMKPTAFLINTSRGPIVDEQAFIEVLKNRKIKGAAVDVYNIEPLPVFHPFRELDNLLMTPHSGYFTKETYKMFYSQMVENIQAWAKGRPMRVLSGNR